MNNILNDAKIRTKLPMAIAGLVALTILVLSFANAFMTQRIVANAAAEKLESAAILKGKQITRLLNKIDTEIHLRAADPSTTDALIALVDSYHSLENAENVLQRVYIEENTYPLGEKDKLVQADTGSSYGLAHATYHPVLDLLMESMGYYDVFLFDTDGNLVYSVFKEDDFATNMITGPWAGSGLAQAYRAAAELDSTDPSAFVDFAPYAPSHDASAAFIARPVFDAQGVRLGVLAYQMPVTQLNEAASDLEGFGETADGFVVGSDLSMRTDSPMTDGIDILSTVVDHPAISAALAGTHAIFKSTGSNGQKVTGFAEPLLFHSTQWVVVVQQNTKELYSGLWSALLLELAVSTAILIVAGFVSIFLSRSISTPLMSLTSAVTDVAAGKTDITVPHTDRGDEIGELARKAEVFRQNAGRIEKMMCEQKETSQRMNEMSAEREKAAQREVELSHERERIDQETRQQREGMMRALGESFGVAVSAALDGNFSKRVKDDFDDKVLNELSGNINDLMTAVDFGLTKTTEALARVSHGDLTQRMTGDFRGAFRNLQGNVNSMMDALTSLVVDISHSGETLSGSSTELQQTADILSRRAEQNAASFEETAAAVEEMTASMAQVNTNMGDVRQNADDARATATESANIANKASESMERIARGSQEINRVTDVINDIAFQINLLALNAGVEAARAGDAGRGFSVVASEVRLLAQRASEAVKEIAQVLGESDAAVSEGVTNVSNTKASLDAISAKVISISENVHDVTLMFSEQASTMNEISSSVALVDSNTQKQSAAFEELTASSHVLSNEARDLEKSTSRFQLANRPKGGSLPQTSPSGHSDTPRPAVAVGAENFDSWE